MLDSNRPNLLFESMLPVRYYLPPEDVALEVLQPTSTKTFCAYERQASYRALASGAEIAWSYPQPLRETAEVTDRVAFFNRTR